MKWGFLTGLLLTCTVLQAGDIIHDSDELKIVNSQPYTGSWTESWENGSEKALGYYRKGLRTGAWTWHDNAGHLLVSGSYRRGLRHGRWAWYSPQGKMEKLQNYVFGERDGDWYEFYENGQAKLLIRYDLSSDYRTHIMWYPDGTRKYYQIFHKSRESYLLENVSTEWYSNGRKRYEGYFNQGEALGMQRWYYPNGNLMISGFAVGERLLGEWTRYNADGSVSGTRINPDNAWVYEWIPMN